MACAQRVGEASLQACVAVWSTCPPLGTAVAVEDTCCWSTPPSCPAPAVVCCQVLGEFLAQINHHEGIYNKLVTVQQVYSQSLAAANSCHPADQQLQHQVRDAGENLGQQQQVDWWQQVDTISSWWAS